MYYHGKDIWPILGTTEPICNVISIRGNTAFPNEPIRMVHQCTKIIIVGSLLRRDITSDRNNVSNWFRSNEDGADLFSKIVNIKYDGLFTCKMWLEIISFVDLRKKLNWNFITCKFVLPSVIRILDANLTQIKLVSNSVDYFQKIFGS